MPCLYKMEIRDSPIHGKGMFALEDIPKAAVYWVWEDPNGLLPVLDYEVKPNKFMPNKNFMESKTTKNFWNSARWLLLC